MNPIIEALFESAATYVGVPSAAMHGHQRVSKAATEARHAVWYVATRRHSMTLVEVARATAHDHSTVHHGITKTVERLRAGDEGTRDLVAVLASTSVAQPSDFNRRISEAESLLRACEAMAGHVEAIGHALVSAGIKLSETVEITREAMLASDAIRRRAS